MRSVEKGLFQIPLESCQGFVEMYKDLHLLWNSKAYVFTPTFSRVLLRLP